jgi:hypothetical protein
MVGGVEYEIRNREITEKKMSNRILKFNQGRNGKELSLVFHADGGHGWLAVKRKLLVELGLESAISSYSYQKGGTVYLEEDCDAPKLLNAIKDYDYVITESYRDRSPIRGYDGYEKPAKVEKSTDDTQLELFK